MGKILKLSEPNSRKFREQYKQDYFDSFITATKAVCLETRNLGNAHVNTFAPNNEFGGMARFILLYKFIGMERPFIDTIHLEFDGSDSWIMGLGDYLVVEAKSIVHQVIRHLMDITGDSYQVFVNKWDNFELVNYNLYKLCYDKDFNYSRLTEDEKTAISNHKYLRFFNNRDEIKEVAYLLKDTERQPIPYDVLSYSTEMLGTLYDKKAEKSSYISEDIKYISVNSDLVIRNDHVTGRNVSQSSTLEYDIQLKNILSNGTKVADRYTKVFTVSSKKLVKEKK